MTKLEKAITAIRSGDKITGRQLLMEILEDDKEHENEQAWLKLAQVLSNQPEQMTCLERILRAIPYHAYTRHRLEKLRSTTSPRAAPTKQKRKKPFILGLLIILVFVTLSAFYLIFNRLTYLPESANTVNTLTTKLITVTPSFVSLISDLSVDIKISSPKISQIYLATFSPEEQDYLILVTTEMERLSQAVVKMNRLLKNPRLSDETWQWDMATQVGSIRASYEAIFNTRPPEGLGKFHKFLVGTINDCHQSTKYLARAVDDFDYNQAEMAGNFMMSCTTKLNNLDAELAKATSDL